MTRALLLSAVFCLSVPHGAYAQTSAGPAANSPSAVAKSDIDSAHPLFGIWQNPSGSVHIKTSACAENVCGEVVYANDKAKADAAKGGTANLIGLNLFQEFAPSKPNEWKGKVMVPDLDKTVEGRIDLVDARTMKVDGCLFGHFACKDQIWTRVD